MDERPKPWIAAGPPHTIVVYPAERVWRFAIQMENGAFMDGFLDECPVGAPPEQVRRAASARVESMGREFHGASLAVEWTPGDRPNWWTGEVVESSDL